MLECRVCCDACGYRFEVGDDKIETEGSKGDIPVELRKISCTAVLQNLSSFRDKGQTPTGSVRIENLHFRDQVRDSSAENDLNLMSTKLEFGYYFRDRHM
jgi:hypothetical protein